MSMNQYSRAHMIGRLDKEHSGEFDKEFIERIDDLVPQCFIENVAPLKRRSLIQMMARIGPEFVNLNGARGLFTAGFVQGARYARKFPDDPIFLDEVKNGQ